MKLTAIDPWADTSPGFNRHAAEVVYKAMAAMDPDTALVYGRLLVAGAVNYDLIAHRGELTKMAADLVAKRAGALKGHYTRTAVAKARAGQDNTHELTCLVHISKAFDYTPQERQRYTAGRTRGEGGRFVRERTPIITNDRDPIDQKHAKRNGVGIPEAKLKGKDLANYQQAYGQIQDMLGPFHNQDLNALLHLKVVNSIKGEERTETVPVQPPGKKATAVAEVLKDGDKIVSAAVSVTPDPRAPAAAAFDTVAALGGRTPGAYTAAGATADAFDGVLGVKRMQQFNEERTKIDPNEPYSTAGQAFGRVQRGSSLLQDSLGDAAPPQLKYALAVANHVGQLGPEAQKVIGPVADRTAYRYRGTERAPDPTLMDAFDKLNASAGNRVNTAEDRRELAIGGTITPENKWEPGRVLRYFRRRLPNPDLNELQRRSGVIPPSEGIVINAKGQVMHQSVGYADDWYLPFNLRHLSALKGGEYIRTRSFGGPTTEDIYTGLVSGAKSMTVVSHNGVFTVDFDENLRGGRRFNDKAARMVARYGHLLDAVRSAQVGRGGISGTRMQELREKVKTEFEPDENSPAFTAKLNELKVNERRNPTLSKPERGQAATDWLGEVAANTTTDGDTVLTADQLTEQTITQRAKALHLQAKEMAARNGETLPYTQAQFREQVAREVDPDGDPEEQVRVIAGMMVPPRTRELDRALEDANQTNKDRVTPLQLDGNGYRDALLALQEQFPYYIARTVYHPWKGSVGIGAESTHEGTRDTGYVAPQFNRPMAAESGYFNERVNGTGKVKADSTRYQNFRVGQGKILDADDPEKKKTDATAAGATTPGKGTASAEDRLRYANAAMLDELLAHTTFGQGAKIGSYVASGADIRTEIKDPRFPNAAIARVFAPGARLQLDKMPPDELNSLLIDLTNLSEGAQPVFVLKPETVAAVRAKGVFQAPTTVPTTLNEMLRQIDTDHAWPGAAYDPTRTLTPKAIEDAYDAEPTIKRLMGNGEELLPVYDDQFDTKIKALTERLRAADIEHVRLSLNGNRSNPVQMQKDKRDAEGLLRAVQLRKRWVEANKNKVTPPTPAGPTTVNTTENHLHGSPEALADLARLLGGIPAAGQQGVIEGN